MRRLNPEARRTRSSARRLAARRLCCALAALGLGLASSRAQAQQPGAEGATAVYVRKDSDRTTVIAPRLRAATPIGETTRVEVLYTVDVWTSASIDIRASASKPITEQRDELGARLSQDLGDLHLRGGYRHSKEPDYRSDGAQLHAELDLAGKATTLGADAVASFDTLGRAGDASFKKPVQTLTFGLSGTQVLDTRTLLQLGYGVDAERGYLSSPYRYVAIGGNQGDLPCRGAVMDCTLEHEPGARLRHALSLRARRALTDMFSVGAGYRFYLDDWHLRSHTLDADLALAPDAQSRVALRYRYYVQNAASFYRSHYDDVRADGLYSRDKKLSPQHSHKVGLDLERAFDLDGGRMQLRAVLSAAGTFYHYDAFPGLSNVQALEITLATVLLR